MPVNAVELAFRPDGFERLDSVGVYLGSFDPLHRGHEWVVAQLSPALGVHSGPGTVGISIVPDPLA